MTTTHPRIQVTLDEKTSGLLAYLAEKQERSLSAIAADLIRDSLEAHEDILLSAHADARFNATETWVSHDDAWK